MNDTILEAFKNRQAEELRNFMKLLETVRDLGLDIVEKTKDTSQSVNLPRELLPASSTLPATSPIAIQSTDKESNKVSKSIDDLSNIEKEKKIAAIEIYDALKQGVAYLEEEDSIDIYTLNQVISFIDSGREHVIDSLKKLKEKSTKPKEESNNKVETSVSGVNAIDSVLFEEFEDTFKPKKGPVKGRINIEEIIK